MQIQKIIKMLDKSNARLVILFCHHNADPDAIGSAYALFKLLKRFKPRLEVEVAASEGLSRLSRKILKKIMIPITDTPHIEDADTIFLLDANTIRQLGQWGARVEASKKQLIVIDHHALNRETDRLVSFSVVNQKASSTCEIVYTLFKEAGVKPEKDEALAIFLGIAFDTRHFILATSDTFKIVADLTYSGIDVKEAISLLSMPIEPSERIARLKAARRIRILKVKQWILASSDVSSYQASSARALLDLGAHVAIVGGKRNGELKISLRAVEDFHKKTGIHLGRDLAKQLGDYIHGIGGGHPTSAGVNGQGDLESAIERCIELLCIKLNNNLLLLK